MPGTVPRSSALAGMLCLRNTTDLTKPADGVIVSANPSAENILGLTFEQMQGKTSTS